MRFTKGHRKRNREAPSVKSDTVFSKTALLRKRSNLDRISFDAFDRHDIRSVSSEEIYRAHVCEAHCVRFKFYRKEILFGRYAYFSD